MSCRVSESHCQKIVLPKQDKGFIPPQIRDDVVGKKYQSNAQENDNENANPIVNYVYMGTNPLYGELENETMYGFQGVNVRAYGQGA